MTLAVLPTTRCPDCGNHLTTWVIHQPALFIDCGYGATQQTTIRRCRSCGYQLEHERTEVRPNPAN